MKKNIPYLLVYYLVFIIGFSAIKHFAGWNAHTFAQLDGAASNFVGAMLAVFVEVILSLTLGVILLLLGRKIPIGKFIIWSTATVIPAMLVVLIFAHFILGFVNDRSAAESSKKLHSEIISRLPADTFKKKSGGKQDFTGYVTIDNDSLGSIVADSNNMAKVYIYVDSIKLGAFNFDSCTVCNLPLQKVLVTEVIPLQSFSSEEVQRNISYINNGQCYVADRNIYLGECRKPGHRFIIINNVYDRVRHVICYEIGFEVDCKTPAADRLELF